MHIGDTGTQAMHRGEVVAAADSALAPGTVAARQTGCAKIQQPPGGDDRSGGAETGDIAEVENQRAVGTALERVALSVEAGAPQRICQA